MTREEMIRRQLALGLPEAWRPTITPDLVEAVAYALGNGFVNAAPEFAEPVHGIALLKYAARIKEAEE